MMTPNQLSSLEPFEARPWVVLVRDEASGSFRQEGPFSLRELRDHVYRGHFQFQDHVWKPGFSRWLPLGELPELAEATQPRAQFSRKDPMEEAIRESAAESINTNEFVSAREMSSARPTPSQREERAPLETDGKDLVSGESSFVPKWRAEDLSILEMEKSRDDEGETFRPVQVSSQVGADLGTSKALRDLNLGGRRRYGKALVVGSALVLLAAAGAFVVTSTSRSSDPGLVGEGTAPVARQPAVPAGAGDVGQKTPPGLEVVGLGLDGSQPALMLQLSETARTQPLEMWVHAGPGAILGRVRDMKYHKWDQVPGTAITFPLASWQLAQGDYVVQLRRGSESIARRIFVGRRNQSFQQAMGQHRAGLRRAAEGEMLELQAAAGNLIREFEDFKKQLLAGGDGASAAATFSDRWQALARSTPLEQVTGGARPQLVYLETWQRLHTFSERLQKEVAQASGPTTVSSNTLGELRAFVDSLPRLRPWDPVMQ